jgi:glutamyl-tRNA reductase
MDELRERELAQLMRRLPALNDDERGQVEQFSRALMNKFLHDPSVRLRMAAAEEAGLGIVDAVRYLFALDEGPTTPTGQQTTASPPDDEHADVRGHASTSENAR